MVVKLAKLSSGFSWLSVVWDYGAKWYAESRFGRFKLRLAFKKIICQTAKYKLQ